MRRQIRLLSLIAAIATAVVVHASAQGLSSDEQRALRSLIELRFDVVPLTDGLALRPKTRRGDLRLIEISDSILVNGAPVTGRELRERVGADADAILRLSYLEPAARRALFAAAEAPEATSPARPERERESSRVTSTTTTTSAQMTTRRSRRSGDRIRIFGDVFVREDEEISGQVVAVLGDVRIEGAVDDQVVAVLGSVELGPRAVVTSDIVTVGGRLRRAEGAQVRGGVTEVSLGGVRINMYPLVTWGPFDMFDRFGGFDPMMRLIGSTFRYLLLAILGSIVLVVARRPLEGAARRVADEPAKATLVGLMAWMLFLPVFVLTAVVLAITIIGIPFLVLLPFAFVLLLLMALVGFSGTAYAVGQWARRRLGMGGVAPFIDIYLGILVILLPLFAGRIVGLGGWPLSPLVFLLLATGVAVEFLAWSCGFGAVLTNTFVRWQARRANRAVPDISTSPSTPSA
jgi:hypothetical protein